MFFRKPVGRYVLQVCRTLSCALNGAERVTEALGERLGIGVGETDASGTFTLLEFECLGACDRAPVVMVNNDHWHERLTPDTVPQFIDDLRVRGLAALTGCHHHVEASGSSLRAKP
jgi:NADH:ubiquinone oxidoreductase subunit E